MTLVVGEAHIVDEQISPDIVNSIFKVREDYQKTKLNKLQLIAFSLQTNKSKFKLNLLKLQVLKPKEDTITKLMMKNLKK